MAASSSRDVKELGVKVTGYADDLAILVRDKFGLGKNGTCTIQ